jgi:COMPASS component SWD1
MGFFSKNRDLVVNATDRTIRSYTLVENDQSPSLELINKFSDAVDRNQWVDCCFSPDDEYIIGGMLINLETF